MCQRTSNSSSRHHWSQYRRCSEASVRRNSHERCKQRHSVSCQRAQKTRLSLLGSSKKPSLTLSAVSNLPVSEQCEHLGLGVLPDHPMIYWTNSTVGYSFRKESLQKILVHPWTAVRRRSIVRLVLVAWDFCHVALVSSFSPKQSSLAVQFSISFRSTNWVGT